MKQRTIFYIIIAIIIVFCSCSRRPRSVIGETKMVDVLYDIQLAQSIYRSNTYFKTDEQKDALIDGVLRKHKITQAELDSSLLWYSDNMEYYIIIKDSVASRLKAENRKLTNLRNAASAGTRKIDYLIPPFYVLNEASPTMAFDIDSMKIKNVDLPNFSLRFDVQGVSPLQKIEASIYYTYKDTLIQKVVPIDSNITYIITKPQLADSLLKSISGYIHLEAKVKGLNSSVMLYNISYTDSISGLKDTDMQDGESLQNSQEKESPSQAYTPSNAEPANKRLEKPGQNDTDKPAASRAGKVKVVDDMPVIRREDADRLLPRNKPADAEELKKSENK